MHTHCVIIGKAPDVPHSQQETLGSQSGFDCTTVRLVLPTAIPEEPKQLRDERPSRLAQLDPWSVQHLEALIALEALAPTAVVGETLLHFDVRADNVLLTPERVWFVDWPHACLGAAWVDVVGLAPSVTMQGGTPPEQVAARHPAYRQADPAAITAAVAALTGFFVHRSLQPAPPGLPTLRAFQAAQGAVARAWLAQRTGWVG